MSIVLEKKCVLEKINFFIRYINIVRSSEYMTKKIFLKTNRLLLCELQDSDKENIFKIATEAITLRNEEYQKNLILPIGKKLIQKQY